MGKKLIFLGLGIIIATILTWNNNSTSEAEVIQRARELGMMFPEEIEGEMQSHLENQLQDGESLITSFINVEIPPGTSAQKVANILTEHNFNGAMFLEEVDKRGIHSQIKFGSYEIQSDATIEEIITLMTN